MTADDSQDLNHQKSEVALSDHPDRGAHRLFSWWFVWVPVIVAVILWLGGWWFGNYGGPWGSEPGNPPPKLSDPAVTMFQSTHTAASGRQHKFAV